MLDDIIEAKRAQLDARKRKTPIDAIRALASMQTRPVPLLNTVTRNEPVMLIGQIRYAPPSDDSAGEMIDPVAEAVRYARAGLDAIALFTDDTVYEGGMDDLMFVARAVRSFNIPVITQDYVIDEYQVVEARAAGAAGLMLTAGLLSPELLRVLVSSTQRNRMTAIVHVADETELENAIAISPQAVALSDRHPITNEVDPGRAARLRALVPGHIRVALCDGLYEPQHVAQAARLNVNALFLSPVLLRGIHLDQLRALAHSPAT